MAEGMVDGYPRQIWWNADGETIVESYTITDMTHGTPLGVADNDERYGAQGAFLIEAGISSSYHIANFFGLTQWIRQSRETASKQAATKQAAKPPSPQASALAAKVIPMPPPASVPMPDLAHVPWPLTTVHRAPLPPPKPRQPQRRGIDVGAVITRALTAAGLMK
jgi:hypothetical protein